MNANPLLQDTELAQQVAALREQSEESGWKCIRMSNVLELVEGRADNGLSATLTKLLSDVRAEFDAFQSKLFDIERQRDDLRSDEEKKSERDRRFAYDLKSVELVMKNFRDSFSPEQYETLSAIQASIKNEMSC